MRLLPHTPHEGLEVLHALPALSCCGSTLVNGEIMGVAVAFEQTFKSLLGPGQEIKLLQRFETPKAKDVHSTHKQISCQFCLEPRVKKSKEQQKRNEPGRWEGKNHRPFG